MEDPGGQQGPEEMLNYINTSSHKVNLKAALDYHSVREPDMELVSLEGRKLYGHRSVRQQSVLTESSPPLLSALGRILSLSLSAAAQHEQYQ